MSEWISVEDRLPEQNQTVLVCDYNGWMVTCRVPVIERNMSLPDDCEFKHAKFTHWMPLPEPPKQGEE